MPEKNERVVRDSSKKRQEATQYKKKMLWPDVSCEKQEIQILSAELWSQPGMLRNPS